MPTTSNFGWTTPADTDLVKDGAAAIRTLGNGIDTSLVDLKGGTTGQILSKNSNTDLDYTWVTPNVGDITEVQAGTGISVASGTGPIPVVTNSMATEITAKGDLIVGTGSGTFDNLAVGTNGHTLVADSSTATGLKWAAGGFTYSSYTPSHNNLTLGNGTATAKYGKSGDFLHYIYRVVWGSTTSASGSAWAPSFPETIDSTSDGWLSGNSLAYDASTGKYYPLIPSIGGSYLYSSPIVGATDSELDGTSVSTTNPFTWATGDKLWINVVWKVA